MPENVPENVPLFIVGLVKVLFVKVCMSVNPTGPLVKLRKLFLEMDNVEAEEFW